MPAHLNTPTIAWQDGALWSVDHADAYASPHGARADREQAFLRGHGFAAESDAHAGRWAVGAAGAHPATGATSAVGTTGADPAVGAAGAAHSWIIGELGFGAGIAFLVTWAALRRHGVSADGQLAQLDWVSVEGAPLDAATLLRAVLSDPAMKPLEPLARELAEAWPASIPGIHRRAFDGGRVRLTLLFGGPLDILPRMPFTADAWNLDGFAPARNPDMWSDEVRAQVVAHSHAGTTVAAVASADAQRERFARAVRVGTGAAGVPSIASSPSAPGAPGSVSAATSSATSLPAWFAQPRASHARTALVIGAGLAGAAAARALAERSIDVDVLDAGGVASGGSGAPRAVLSPHIASWSSPQCRVVAQAFLHARAVLKRVGAPLETCGLLQALHEDDAWGHEQAVHEWGWPKDALEVVDSADAALLAGTSIGGRPAVWVAEACVTQPALAVRALLDHPRIRVHPFTSVDTLHQTNDGWALVTRGAGAERAPQFAPIVVIATAGAWTPVHTDRNDADDDDNAAAGAASAAIAAAANTDPNDAHAAIEIDRTAPLASSALADVPFEHTRGQLTMLATTGAAPLAVVRSGGFVLPPHAGSLCVGATHDRDSDDLSPTTHDDAQNLETLDRLLPGSREANTVPDRTARWVGLRATVNDRCPVVGAVPDFNAFRAAFAALRHGPIAQEWPPAPVVHGLYATLAHGSRGTSTALLAGELLADIVTGSPRCVADDLLPALLPQRFLVRALRRSEDGSVP